MCTIFSEPVCEFSKKNADINLINQRGFSDLDLIFKVTGLIRLEFSAQTYNTHIFLSRLDRLYD